MKDQGICRIVVPTICWLCCPTTQFCGTSTGCLELVVNGLDAKHRHWNCAIFCPSFTCQTCFCLRISEVLLLDFCARFQMNFFEENFWVNQTWKIDVQKRFPAIRIGFHVSSGNLVSRLSKARELRIVSGWLETWDNLPLQFDSISWNSPEPFIEFICSCICCNWKVSCWIVSWFSLNFCIEHSSTCDCALFIFSISCLLRICVSRRAPFVTIPLAIEFVLDEIQQIRFVRPAVPCFAPPFVFANHWCTHWVTQHEVLCQLDLILPDSASDLYCLRAEFHSNSTDCRFRTQNSTFGFSVHYILMKSVQPVSRKLSDLLMNETFAHLLLHLRDQSPQCFPWTCRSASGTGGRTFSQQVTSLPSRDPLSFVSQFVQIPSLLQQLELVDLVLQNLSVHRAIDRCLPENFHKLSQALWSQPLWAQNLWERCCAGFRHSRTWRARAVQQRCLSTVWVLEEVLGVQCRPGEGRAVQVVLRVVVDWKRESEAETSKEMTWLTRRQTLFMRTKMTLQFVLEPWATNTYVICACEMTVVFVMHASGVYSVCINNELIYRMNQLFGTRVLCSSNLRWNEWMLCLSFASRFHDSRHWHFLSARWPVSLNRCAISSAVTIPLPFLSVRRIAIPLLFRPCTQECPMTLREFHCVILDFLLHSKCNSQHSFSTQCRWTLTWRWSRPWTPLAGFPFSPSRAGFLEEQTMMKILWNFSTRSQLLLHRHPLHLGKTNTTWVLPLDLSIFLLLLECLSSVQHTERNQHRHTLLPSPIWSLDHWLLPIPPRKVMNTPGISHSEFLQNVPLPTFEQCSRRSQYLRISCPCRIPNSTQNSGQSGWRLSLTKSWTFPMYICFVCFHRECCVRCRKSQPPTQKLKDLAHALMVRVFHVFPLWWRSKFPRACGVGIFPLITFCLVLILLRQFPMLAEHFLVGLHQLPGSLHDFLSFIGILRIDQRSQTSWRDFLTPLLAQRQTWLRFRRRRAFIRSRLLTTFLTWRSAF